LQFENNIEYTTGSVYNYHIRTKRGGFIFPSCLLKSERIFTNIPSGLNSAVKLLYLRQLVSCTWKSKIMQKID